MALIGHWALQDASGPTAAASVGSAGTYVGTLNYQVAGPGGAYLYAIETLGTGFAIGPASITDYPFSYAIWAYDEGGPLNNAPIGVVKTNSISVQWAVVYSGANYMLRRVANDVNSVDLDLGIAPDTNWHHFAVVFHAQDHVQVFRDAISIYNNASAPVATFLSTDIDYLSMGNNRSTVPNKVLLGRLADGRIYDHALSAAEVTAIYDLVANPGGGGVDPQRFQLNSIRRGSYVVQSAGLNGALS